MGQVEVRSRSEPVSGWRYWQLAVHPTVQLRSLSQRGFTWQPGRALVARCADRSWRADAMVDGDDHHAPVSHCGCGVNASIDLASLHAQALCLRPVPLVVGEVELWGRVITEERADHRGRDYRGQFAYPRRLLVVRETVVGGAVAVVVEGLGAYGVPVEITSLEEAVGEVSQTILNLLTMSGATGCPAPEARSSGLTTHPPTGSPPSR